MADSITLCFKTARYEKILRELDDYYSISYKHRYVKDRDIFSITFNNTSFLDAFLVSKMFNNDGKRKLLKTSTAADRDHTDSRTAYVSLFSLEMIHNKDQHITTLGSVFSQIDTDHVTYNGILRMYGYALRHIQRALGKQSPSSELYIFAEPNVRRAIMRYKLL